jgi:spermidine/putrescine transport system ATP-binding protein
MQAAGGAHNAAGRPPGPETEPQNGATERGQTLPAPILRLDGVTKRFGTFTALHGIDLEIEEGEFFTIVGPSGSGKSTLIRLLVGMEELTSGAIWLRDARIDHVPANRRPTCMVFQSLALFPHMTVGQNIEFPLKIRGVTPEQRRRRADELLDLLRLPRDYHSRRINQCSGGERQRVALARALAFEPEILFFDEPLAALDYRLRKTLEKELKELHTRTGKTFVYITHSLEEAMVMSDRIAILRAGRFEQIATADTIYARPSSRFVAEFMGEVNLFGGTVENGAFRPEEPALHLNGTPATLGLALPASGAATIMVRPEFLRFLSEGETADFLLRGELIEHYALGSRLQYEIGLPSGRRLTVEKLREDAFAGPRGSAVLIGFDADHVHIIEGT